MNATGADLTDELSVAWREHRPYVAAAVAMFVVGVLAGIAMVAADVDLLALMGVEDFADVFPEDFTTWTILANNTRVFLLMIVGAITLGLLTLFAVVFNGVFLGFFLTPIVGEVGWGFVVLAIVPHGILELPALFVAAGVGFRLVHLGIARLLGDRERLFEPGEPRRIALLVGVAWVVLAVAAAVEVHVTPALVEAVYGTDPEAVS